MNRTKLKLYSHVFYIFCIDFCNRGILDGIFVYPPIIYYLLNLKINQSYFIYIGYVLRLNDIEKYYNLLNYLIDIYSH